MKLTIVIFILLLTLKGFSQSFIDIGINGSAGNKTFPKNGKIGVGVSAEYYLPLFSNGGLKAYVGYDYFHHNISNPDSLRVAGYHGQNMAFIPIRIGYEHFLITNKLFIYGEAGIFKIQSSSPYLPKKTGFTYAFGGGYRFNFERSFLQLSAIYNLNTISKLRLDNYFTLRTSYALIYKK